jgi:Leucine-rich repeat (LRR) protein
MHFGTNLIPKTMKLASTTTNKDIIGVLKKMKNNILDLSDGALRSVAIESISEDNISGLNLANNLLGKIPPKLLSKLLNMKELTTLSLADNNMATVPDEIGNLVQLTNLNLAGNRLDGLPSSMGNLVNLKVCLSVCLSIATTRIISSS